MTGLASSAGALVLSIEMEVSKLVIRRRLWGGWMMRSLLLAVFLVLMLPAFAVAVPSARALVLPTTQLWVLLIGAAVPLVTYVLNHVGPWLSEPVKAFVLALVTVIVTSLYTAVSTNVFGFNDATLQLVASGVLAAFLAHTLVWKPAGVSTILGGGRNRQAVAPVAPEPVARAHRKPVK